MSKVQEALKEHMAVNGTGQDEIVDLLSSGSRARALLTGEDSATLYEATLFASYFKTSVRDFIETNPR